MKLLKGKLRCITASKIGAGCCASEYFFETLEGEKYEITDYPTAMIFEEIVEVQLQGTEILHFTPLIANALNETRKDIALVRVVTDESELTPGVMRGLQSMAEDLETAYLKVSDGNWEVAVKTYTMVSDCRRNVMGTCWGPIKRMVDANHNYWHGWGGSQNGICGHAYVSGREAWTFENCGNLTAIHEQGHNFGCHHSGTLDHEYGERDAYMGSGNARVAFNGPHILHMGLIGDSESYILAPNSSACVHLVRPDDSSSTLRKGEFKIIQVDKAFANRFAVAVFRDRVRVYYAADGRNWGRTIQLASLAPSSEYDGEIYVKYLEEKDGSHKVIVKWNKELGEPKLKPFPEYKKAEQGEDISKVFGHWYNPSIPAQGVEILTTFDEENGHQIIANVYTTNLSGRQVWRSAQAPLPTDGLTAELDAGGFNMNSFVPTGKVYITMIDENNIKLDMVDSVLGRTSVELTRLTKLTNIQMFNIVSNVKHQGVVISRSTREEALPFGYLYHHRTSQEWLYLDANQETDTEIFFDAFKSDNVRNFLPTSFGGVVNVGAGRFNKADGRLTLMIENRPLHFTLSKFYERDY